jgi:hypothetical protein
MHPMAMPKAHAKRIRLARKRELEAALRGMASLYYP